MSAKEELKQLEEKAIEAEETIGLFERIVNRPIIRNTLIGLFILAALFIIGILY